MVVLSLSSVPEETGSHIHDLKNVYVHTRCWRVQAQYFGLQISFLVVSSEFFLIALVLSLSFFL